MVVKVEESFEKTRHVKNDEKSTKYTLRGQKIQDIMKNYYQIKINLIICSLYMF